MRGRQQGEDTRVAKPLGLCLGMFMPLGLGVVNGLSDHPDEYIAWAWAVNGFFSVIGSVLTTILSQANEQGLHCASGPVREGD